MRLSKITLISSLGSALEYYDFIIYILLAPFLSQVFFPTADARAAMLATLTVFAIGYIARPVGGLIFAHFADRYGRKRVFTLAIGLMALSTLVIGLLPTYAHWGLVSTMLLFSCRLLQGVSQGAELPGAITFIAEHAMLQKRGLNLGLMFMGVSLGATLSTLVNYGLHVFLDFQQILAWGWRIPFLLGAVLGLIAYYLRRYSSETPLFQQQQQPLAASIPMMQVLRYHLPSTMRGIMLTLFPACFILFALFLPTYLQLTFQYSSRDVYLAMSISLVWSGVLLPLFGALSDQIGRQRLYLIGSCASLVTLYSLFNLLHWHSLLALYGFMMSYQTLVAMLAACYPSLLAESFPTRVRFSGVAICYNLSFLIASFTPMIASLLISHIQQPAHISFMFMPLIVVGMVAVSRLPKHASALS